MYLLDKEKAGEGPSSGSLCPTVDGPSRAHKNQPPRAQFKPGPAHKNGGAPKEPEPPWPYCVGLPSAREGRASMYAQVFIILHTIPITGCVINHFEQIPGSSFENFLVKTTSWDTVKKRRLPVRYRIPHLPVRVSKLTHKIMGSSRTCVHPEAEQISDRTLFLRQLNFFSGITVFYQYLQ